jgi:hypothetical protein
VQDAFKAEGVKYTVSELTKSELYIESLPLWTRGGIIIPDHARLLRELRLLERRTSRSGRDSVDHGQSGSDDYANALIGCAVMASGKRKSLVISDAALANARMPDRAGRGYGWGTPRSFFGTGNSF